MTENGSRRVVAKLTKMWDQVITKGKLMSENVNLPKLPASSQLLRVSPPPSAHVLAQRFRHKVNTSMSAYEDFIGISQVKAAHSRVLQAEMNFLASQNDRRDAQRELTDVQSQLGVLRVEIDRTARGDDRYLELIKKEIGVIREERLLRSRFEQLEKHERDLFSELSNALRFSHEKERAQNEKTKYWGIFGSIIGACLGILGATINSKLKQQQTKAILSQTTVQVQEIQQTLNNLTAKLNSNGTLVGVATSTDLEHFVHALNTTYEEHVKRLNSERKSLVEATHTLESKMQALLIALSYAECEGGTGVKRPPLIPLPEIQGDSAIPQNMWIATLGFLALVAFTYKFY